MDISGEVDSNRIQQILSKNQQLLESGDYYEYEQKISSQGFRFSSTNKTQSAISLYFIAAKELLKRGQINSGFGLANKIMDLIPRGPIDQKIQDEFLSLYSVAQFGEPKLQFINKVLQKYGQDEVTKEQICHSVGVDLINNGKYHLAWRYLLHVKNIEIQHFLLQKMNSSLPSQDAELTSFRYILIKLSIGDYEQAKILFQGLTISMDTPLMNFLGLLIQSITLRSQKCFELLYKNYQTVFSVDPLFKLLLLKVGSKYFDLPEQSSGGGIGGLFSQIFSN